MSDSENDVLRFQEKYTHLFPTQGDVGEGMCIDSLYFEEYGFSEEPIFSEEEFRGANSFKGRRISLRSVTRDKDLHLTDSLSLVQAGDGIDNLTSIKKVCNILGVDNSCVRHVTLTADYLMCASFLEHVVLGKIESLETLSLYLYDDNFHVLLPVITRYFAGIVGKLQGLAVYDARSSSREHQVVDVWVTEGEFGLELCKPPEGTRLCFSKVDNFPEATVFYEKKFEKVVRRRKKITLARREFWEEAKRTFQDTSTSSQPDSSFSSLLLVRLLEDQLKVSIWRVAQCLGMESVLVPTHVLQECDIRRVCAKMTPSVFVDASANGGVHNTELLLNQCQLIVTCKNVSDLGDLAHRFSKILFIPITDRPCPIFQVECSMQLEPLNVGDIVCFADPDVEILPSCNFTPERNDSPNDFHNVRGFHCKVKVATLNLSDITRFLNDLYQMDREQKSTVLYLELDGERAPYEKLLKQLSLLCTMVVLGSVPYCLRVRCSHVQPPSDQYTACMNVLCDAYEIDMNGQVWQSEVIQLFATTPGDRANTNMITVERSKAYDICKFLRDKGVIPSIWKKGKYALMLRRKENHHQ